VQGKVYQIESRILQRAGSKDAEPSIATRQITA